MRSRPDVKVYLEPRQPAPGDRIYVRVRLESRSVTPYDAVDVVLEGRESRFKRTVRTGKTSVRRYYRREVLRLGARFEGGVLEPGTWERELTIDLPPDAPPTYRSSLATVSYELVVRVHIPWWPDREERYAVVVLPPSRSLGAPRAQVYTTQQGEHRGTEPVLELSLENVQLALGGELRGAVSVLGLGGRRLRRIALAWSAIESPQMQSSVGPTEVARRTWTVHEGTPAEGEPVAFRLALPADMPATFATPFFRVDHAVEAVAVVAFGRDVEVRARVVAARPAPGAASRARAPGAVPLVGRPRHLAVWREAVDRVQVARAEQVRFDPDEARAVFVVRDVAVSVTEEHREDHGPCLVATLDWPALGLDLRVAERRWTELGGRLDELDRGFQKRFTVRAREPAQAALLLDEALRSVFECFDEAGLDDEGAVVLRKGGVYQVLGLERFLALAAQLATQAAAAIARVPPPAALASALEAWQRFAARHDATLRVGDLSLHNWALRGVPLTLDHGWEAVRPVQSRLWTGVPEGADPQAWAQALGAAVGRPGVAREGRAGVVLPLVTDPEAVLACADRMAEAASGLLRGPEARPYR